MSNNIDPFDVNALEKAVNDSAVRVSTLWVTYLIFGLYLVTATVNVTPRQLLLSEAIKLPVLNVDLPLVGFFVLAPMLFAIFHGYVLLQVLLLGRTAAAYNDAIDRTITNEAYRTRIRQRLANTIFAQLFAGSPRERDGLLGVLLMLIAWLALVIGPVSILISFYIKFLPYHSYLVTWLHRFLIGIDFVAVSLLWVGALNPQQDIGWSTLLQNWKLSLVGLIIFAATCLLISFPGEFHFTWSRYDSKKVVGRVGATASQCNTISILAPILSSAFDRFSMRGEVLVDDDEVRKFERATTARGLSAFAGQRTHDFHGRNFACSDFSGADLRRVDFHGATMTGANLNSANLEGASLNGARLQYASFNDSNLRNADLSSSNMTHASLSSAMLHGANLRRAQLQAADLSSADLTDAVIYDANFQGADFGYAKIQGQFFAGDDMRGVSFARAQLYGAVFKLSRLQGASFFDAGLQGATFQGAQLEGASFVRARLQGATFLDTELTLVDFSLAYLWRAQAANCHGARSANINLDPVIGRSIDGPGQLPATKEGLEKLVKFAVGPLSEQRQQSVEQNLRQKLSSDNHEDGNFWQSCIAMGTGANSFDEQFAGYLVELACSANEQAEFIASGIRSYLPHYYDGIQWPQIVAGRFLKLSGMSCPAMKGISSDDRESLERVIAPRPSN